MDKKVERIIKMYSHLLEGKVIKKQIEAERFGVNQRTIQRDINDIRTYFANDMDVDRQVIYDRHKRGYVLIGNRDELLTSQDVLMICKVFLGSSALVKYEMLSMVDKLIQCCVPYDEQKKIITLVANEKFHYIEPQHDKELKAMVWDIAEAVYYQKLIRIVYKKENREEVLSRIIQPAGIMFSKGRFYLTAYLSYEDNSEREKQINQETKDVPSIYRIDGIVQYEVLEEHFHIPYKNRFEEGEFRKSIDLEIAAGWEEDLQQ